MDTENTRTRKRPERPTPAAREAAAKPQLSTRPEFWLVLQGDVVDLIESKTQPDLTTKKGERRKMIVGAFADRDRAMTSLERIRKRARGIVGKGDVK
jgi:hypothetical protein